MLPCTYSPPVPSLSSSSSSSSLKTDESGNMVYFCEDLENSRDMSEDSEILLGGIPRFVGYESRNFRKVEHFISQGSCSDKKTVNNGFNRNSVRKIKRSIQEACLSLDSQQEVNRGNLSLPAFVFDIDGVFKNGGKYAEFGAKAIRKLQKAHIPYVFMTNGGGGRTEKQYAEVMNEKLSQFDSERRGTREYVKECQMILSYTPFQTHLSHLKDEPVLIVGCPRAIYAARKYGFTRAMALSEYARRHPTMNPFKKGGCEKDGKVITTGTKERWNENFRAVLVFTDPQDFFEALQIITDVLLSSRPGEREFEPSHRIPIVFSNPDLLWKTQYAHARFGQGAFRLSLEACYKARMQAMGLDGEEIEDRLNDFIQFGKPEPAQFMHARAAVLEQAKAKGDDGCSISHFYMVGDNPRSDITGAVRMQKLLTDNKESKHTRGWSGMLVKTGVWQEGDDTMGASEVHENVMDVIDAVLERHKQEIAQFTDTIEAVWE